MTIQLRLPLNHLKRRLGSILSSPAILVFVFLLSVWEVIGDLTQAGVSWLPPLSQIVRQVWLDRADYYLHSASTVRNAAIGFILGNCIAIGLALTFELFPLLGRVFRGSLTALFSVPLIILAPIIAARLDPGATSICLVILLVYYPTLRALQVGLASTDSGLIDVIRVAGGGDFMVLRQAKFWAGLPALLSGLRAAIPAAMLGSMLGEFAGAREGLGKYLVGSMTGGSPTKTWATALMATVFSAVPYLLLGPALSWLNRTMAGSGAAQSALAPARTRRSHIGRIAAQGLGSVAIGLTLWASVCALLSLSESQGLWLRGPVQVAKFLGEMAPDARSALVRAFSDTFSSAALGIFFGIGVAFVFATLLTIKPALAAGAEPFALVSQTVPLTALAPLLVLALGRGTAATVGITISVTFFPSFLLIHQGLSQVSPDLVNVCRVYRDSPISIYSFLRLPNALPFIFAAIKLVTPRALMGVMLAEYIATGRGVGFVVYSSRGSLDFDMIWAVATLTAVLSLALTLCASLGEASAHRMGSSEHGVA